MCVNTVGIMVVLVLESVKKSGGDTEKSDRRGLSDERRIWSVE